MGPLASSDVPWHVEPPSEVVPSQGQLSDKIDQADERRDESMKL